METVELIGTTLGYIGLSILSALITIYLILSIKEKFYNLKKLKNDDNNRKMEGK